MHSDTDCKGDDIAMPVPLAAAEVGAQWKIRVNTISPDYGRLHDVAEPCRARGEVK
jgi:hypothetical protein